MQFGLLCPADSQGREGPGPSRKPWRERPGEPEGDGGPAGGRRGAEVAGRIAKVMQEGPFREHNELKAVQSDCWPTHVAALQCELALLACVAVAVSGWFLGSGGSRGPGHPAFDVLHRGHLRGQDGPGRVPRAGLQE